MRGKITEFLDRCLKLFDNITNWILWLTFGCTLLITFLTTANVIARRVFNSPIDGAAEIIEELMVIAVFMAIAYIQNRGGHIRVDILTSRLNHKVRSFFYEVFANLIGFIVLGVLSWRSIILLTETLSQGSYKPGVIAIPLAPAHFATFIGSTIFAILLLIMLIKGVVDQFVVSRETKG